MYKWSEPLHVKRLHVPLKVKGSVWKFLSAIMGSCPQILEALDSFKRLIPDLKTVRANILPRSWVCLGKLSQLHQPPPLSPPQPTPLFLLYPCLTPISLAGWLVAPYRPSVQPLQPLALHHLHPTTPTLPGPVPTIVPDSTTSSSYSNKMASLELSPTTTDSPNVTLTIRLIMQGKVSTTLLLPLLSHKTQLSGQMTTLDFFARQNPGA